MPSQILLVEDHEDARISLETTLSIAGYEVVAVPDKNLALKRIAAQHFDAVLIDLRLPSVVGGDEHEENGLAVVQAARREFPNAWIAVITAYGDATSAHSAWTCGADEFFDKPLDYEDLFSRLDLALTVRQPQENSGEFYQWPTPPPPELIEGTEIIGASDVMRTLCDKIHRVAESPAKVLLLTGETGTGKELFAAALHQLSERRSGPYESLNCTAITASMAESALFGVGRNSATGVAAQEGGFKRANGGTLLLDEFGDLNPTIQPKLLRALDSGEIQLAGGQIERVDVRVVLATNRDLNQAVKNQSFRSDLLQRRDSATIEIPPLRARKADIPYLTNHFIRQYLIELGEVPDHPKSFPLKEIAKTVWELLDDYNWGGNIRELRRVVRTALTNLKGTVLSAGDILRAGILVAKEQPELQRPDNVRETWYSWTKTLADGGREVNYDHFKRYAVIRAIREEITERGPGIEVSWTAIGRRIGISRNPSTRIQEVIRAIASDMAEGTDVKTLIQQIRRRDADEFISRAIQYYEQQLPETKEGK